MRSNMIKPGTPSIISDDLIRRMRETARRPTSVRELTGLIQADLGCKDDAVIPVLAAFLYSFQLPLIKLLPIREWLGSDKDAEIDSLILPEIEAARHKWDAPHTSANGQSQGVMTAVGTS